MTTINEKNIFDMGMLVTLKAGGYDGRRKLDPEQLKDLPREIVRGSHDMFDKEFKNLLDLAYAPVNQCRNFIKDLSIPFPVGNVYFVKTSKIQEVIDFIEKKKIERQEVVDRIAEEYKEAIQIFAEKYPAYYQAAKDKYLSIGELKARFHMNYQFFQMSSPDKKGKLISEEQYKQEQEKFKNAINEMKEGVMATIYQTLLDTTTKLQKQCQGSKINQATIKSMNGFLQKINEVYSDFLDRDDLKTIIGKIKKQMIGIDAEEIRSSEQLKKDFGQEMAKLAEEIRVLPDVPVRRAIDL